MLQTVSVERIGDMRCEVGESPLWLAHAGVLYWTDITGRRLWRFDEGTGRADSWALPEMAGSLAAIEGGGLALAMESGIYRVPVPQPGDMIGTPQPLARVAHARADMRFNDGRCDRQGRFIAGTMVLDTALALPLGMLLQLDTAGRRFETLERGLIVSNGLAFSPDGRTMYLSDSHASRQTVWAFEYDVDTGKPYNRRIFIDMTAHAGRPDGAAVDADGCYWICGNDAGQVHRFTPDGRLDRSIEVPVAKPAMCAFGGERLDTLYVTSIRTADDPLSGALFAMRPGVTGLPEPAMRL
ncbi:SMP-30/gluconolactonase/LRE family protein [Trinickia caryophylli]|uniref:Sugar lactone lactonase YvrE n=1 Tax=Trinickia caryophylli TaxID=28094 RepID=A0A1X7H135_TRICW|nr:SMP-30/gluconolactonase/LRE family protein [Trinickia caryophylli]PMS09953.1 SMP-30/gluconolactonase/LRE family protein [Trinickia caryophylli]TRX18303.1 SMP-30/gluconolactonase/LRE family protein [Trinickia caryophylli]WQE10914.1 SMP-30/gluconolactonase/LRE family protein [Trinickia caryophylli]SMF77718.1 Sugar lactone lactonase YvrE [Trinickia caryophylli]GLU35566.1 gluconolactonase [Trinickia caryophylli]